MASHGWIHIKISVVLIPLIIFIVCFHIVFKLLFGRHFIFIKIIILTYAWAVDLFIVFSKLAILHRLQNSKNIDSKHNDNVFKYDPLNTKCYSLKFSSLEVFPYDIWRLRRTSNTDLVIKQLKRFEVNIMCSRTLFFT